MTGLFIGLLSIGLASADPQPFPMPDAPAPTPPNRNAPPEPPPGVDFGTDFAVGYFAGSLLGAWPDPGWGGVATGRLDTFVQSRDAPGWRLGLSLWGSTTLGPLQTGTDLSAGAPAAGATSELRFNHYGAMTVLRPEPTVKVAPLFGVGLSRLDLSEGYHGGPLALPLVSFEAGVRQLVGAPVFLDWTVRAHHGTARSGADPTRLEEWWLIQGGLQVGLHVR